MNPGLRIAVAIVGRPASQVAAVAAHLRAVVDLVTDVGVERADAVVLVGARRGEAAAVSRRAAGPTLELTDRVGDGGVLSELRLWRAGRDLGLLQASVGGYKAQRPIHSLRRARAKSAQFPARSLPKLVDRPTSQDDTRPDAARASCAPGVPSSLSSPAPRSGIEAAVQVVQATLKRIVEKAAGIEQWAVVLDAPRDPFDPVDLAHGVVLAPPADRFWADPFIVEREGRLFVFLEELPFATGKGVLSVVEVGRHGPIGSPRLVLECDHHLSYPFVFEWQGTWYMIPETADAGCLQVYRCAAWPDRWELVSEQLQGRRLADPTLLERDGRWWMLCSGGAPDGALDDELFVFTADTPLGPWTQVGDGPWVSDARVARPAGRVFEHRGRLIRPSQDCGEAYGRAVVLNEITRLDAGGYAERPVGRLELDPDGGGRCLHTINLCAGLRVTDALRVIPRWPRSHTSSDRRATVVRS